MKKFLLIMICILGLNGCVQNSSGGKETIEHTSIAEESSIDTTADISPSENEESSIDITNATSTSENEENTMDITDDTFASEEQESSTHTKDDEELVTLIYGTVNYYMMDHATMKAINEYLAKEGCSYQIQCVNLITENTRLTTKEYAELVKNYVEEGKQLDICYLGTTLFDNPPLTSYDILRQEEYLEDLTPYFNCELGKQLKESMPEAQWESLTIDGGIYGLNGYIYTTQSGVTYVVSKELMEKYDISEKDLNKPLSELTPLLEKVQKEEEKENPNFACVNYVCNFSDLDFSKLYPADIYIKGVCLDENQEENPVIYTLEDEELIGFLKELYDVYSNEKIGVTRNGKVVYENNFLNVFVSGEMWEYNIERDNRYVSNNKTITVEDIEIFHPYDSSMRIKDRVVANAIMKTSKQKEAAFDFLCRMYSDPHLINLVLYGADYVVEDGYAYEINGDGEKEKSRDLYSSWMRGNGFISASLAFEPVDKKEKIFELYDTYGYVSPYAGFRFDGTGYEELKSSTNKVISRLRELFTGKVTDFDAFIQELRIEFKEAGGKELYEAVKEQWLDYKQAK